MVCGIQSGRFYIDLGVLNQDSEFVLGILSDQTVLSQTSSISAVELANERLLMKNGWRIFRLRQADCFDSIDREITKITKLLTPKSEMEELI